ncbi:MULTISPECIES: DUF4136 domain-containing protein [unclassified Novosphingobium]|uniref:DUF4136 domain-containing protein n=1 Tax=unclassified Novosphingobium TaxID=2644732 RepID=UPI000F5FA93B|nr:MULTISPECIES: DUF4136 domain-containing protein [unclassified Novosphingobium]MBF5090215.1 DUF4136 domain-containing protein [Novosphingobium sp. NBM11]RQW42338.1 DUF4136 domain-containing protein [Novosphingobium sp. LASN5T]
MRRLLIASALVLAALPAAPGVAFAAPVEVTRFHTAESLAKLVPGAALALAPAPGEDPAGLETALWNDAVMREVAARGFGTATAGAADALVEVRVERRTERQERQRGPVSVGVGGSTGGWNSGVGLGVGFSLGGGSREWTETRLSVTIRDRATGQALWEGRAESRDNAKKKEADAANVAPRLAHALFTDFPGKSGQTIQVK